MVTLPERASAFGPGHIGIASHFLGRYREFDACMARVVSPPGSSYQFYMSVDVCTNFNHMIRRLMKHDNFEWLWILGDDHLFMEDILVNLLERNVDIVTPLCCRRLAPYYPILHRDGAEGIDCRSYPEPWNEIKGKTGLMDWTGTSGNAGMLIRRKVLEAMSDPWFENGKVSPGVGASDLYFWHKAHQYGFKTYLDLDNSLGHLTHVAVWPHYTEESGEWFFRMITP